MKYALAQMLISGILLLLFPHLFMRIASLKKTVCVLGFALLVTACGSNRASLTGDGSTQVQTDGGLTNIGKTMPSDWPEDVSVYVGSSLEYSATTNPGATRPLSAIVIATTDNTETVVGYYRNRLVADGWTINRDAHAGGSTLLAATKDTRSLSVLIAAGVDGKTNITLGIGQK